MLQNDYLVAKIGVDTAENARASERVMRRGELLLVDQWILAGRGATRHRARPAGRARRAVGPQRTTDHLVLEKALHTLSVNPTIPLRNYLSWDLG